MEVKEARITVDTSEVWENGPDSSEVHLSYWLPNNTLDGARVPVIAVISPYFSYGPQGSESTPTNVIGAARGEFIFDNSFHMDMHSHKLPCSAQRRAVDADYRGAGEGLGIHAAVEWLGS